MKPSMHVIKLLNSIHCLQMHGVIKVLRYLVFANMMKLLKYTTKLLKLIRNYRKLGEEDVQFG